MRRERSVYLTVGVVACNTITGFTMKYRVLIHSNHHNYRSPEAIALQGWDQMSLGKNHKANKDISRGLTPIVQVVLVTIKENSINVWRKKFSSLGKRFKGTIITEVPYIKSTIFIEGFRLVPFHRYERWEPDELYSAVQTSCPQEHKSIIYLNI